MKKNSCVLLIEDDPVSVYIAIKAIKTIEFFQEIKVVKNGVEALEFLKAKKESNQPAPELIFVDINMPVSDGQDFYKSFKQIEFINKNDIICCILTNSTHQKDIEYFKLNGVHEYINKPLNKDIIQKIYNQYFFQG